MVTTKIKKKSQDAYNLLIELIEDYNVRLLSTKIYWDKPSEREEYKEFWNNYKKIQKIKDEDFDRYEKEKQALFIKADLKKLSKAKRNYNKIIKFYKKKLVELGKMKELSNTCTTSDKIYSRTKREAKKEIG